MNNNNYCYYYNHYYYYHIMLFIAVFIDRFLQKTLSSDTTSIMLRWPRLLQEKRLQQEEEEPIQPTNINQPLSGFVIDPRYPREVG